MTRRDLLASLAVAPVAVAGATSVPRISQPLRAGAKFSGSTIANSDRAVVKGLVLGSYRGFEVAFMGLFEDISNPTYSGRTYATDGNVTMLTHEIMLNERKPGGVRHVGGLLKEAFDTSCKRIDLHCTLKSIESHWNMEE